VSENITVRELIDRLYAATQRMGRKNSHRALMLHSMSALMQLSKQVEQASEPQPEPVSENRVQLVTLQ
jgi:hypothetical protein